MGKHHCSYISSRHSLTFSFVSHLLCLPSSTSDSTLCIRGRTLLFSSLLVQLHDCSLASSRRDRNTRRQDKFSGFHQQSHPVACPASFTLQIFKRGGTRRPYNFRTVGIKLAGYRCRELTSLHNHLPSSRITTTTTTTTSSRMTRTTFLSILYSLGLTATTGFAAPLTKRENAVSSSTLVGTQDPSVNSESSATSVSQHLPATTPT